MQKLVDAPEDGVELELFRGLATDLYNPQVRRLPQDKRCCSLPVVCRFVFNTDTVIVPSCGIDKHCRARRTTARGSLY